VVAMAEAWNVAKVDEVRFSLGHEVKPVLATRKAIRVKLRVYFQQAEKAEEGGDLLQEALHAIEGEQPKPGQGGLSEQRLRQESASAASP